MDGDRGDNIQWTYEITVPAGETVRLAHFTILADTRAAAEAAAATLVTSSGFGGQAAAVHDQHRGGDRSVAVAESVEGAVDDLLLGAGRRRQRSLDRKQAVEPIGGGVPFEVRQARQVAFAPVGWQQGAAHAVAERGDAFAGVGIPFVEVHLSNVHKREPFRHHSNFSDLAVGVIAGLGPTGYRCALQFAIETIRR
jgi:hypothetical protein